MSTRPDLTLDPKNWDSLRKLGHQMLDDMFDYLQEVREAPVWRSMPASDQSKFEEGLPYRPQDPEAVYADFKELVLPYPTGNIHPRFWGWVMGGGNAVSMLADMLAATINSNVCLGDHSAMKVEQQVLAWSKQLLGYPASASGLLVSGASMANLTALIVARNHASGGDMRRLGARAMAGEMVMYCSGETHNCIRKAAEVMGMGAGSVRTVPVDEQFRIRTDLLEEIIQNDIAEGCIPFCIVGNAGTVNTGAIDPLDELLAISRKYRLWFHVDGAFGALAKPLPEYAALLHAIEEADSVAFDYHKWMHIPYEAACVLVRNAEAQRQAFAQTPNYLLQHERGVSAGSHSFGDYGIELSRGFKALKIWMSLKTYGVFAFMALIRQNISQARYLAQLIEQHPHLELLAPVDLNIVCFRYIHTGWSSATAQDVNKEILMRLQEEGIATVSATVIQGRYALRAAVSNHRSRAEDFDLLAAQVVRLGNVITESVCFG